MGNKQSSNRSRTKAAVKVETQENEPIEQPPVNSAKQEPTKSILAKTPNDSENIDKRLAEIKEKRLRLKLTKEDKYTNCLKTTSIESNVTKLPIVLKVVGTNTDRNQVIPQSNDTSLDHFRNNYEDDYKINRNSGNIENFSKKFNLRIEKNDKETCDKVNNFSEESDSVSDASKEVENVSENKAIDEEENNESTLNSSDIDTPIDSDTVKPEVLNKDEDQYFKEHTSVPSERSDSSSLNEEDVARELEELIRENDFEESPRPPKRKKKLAALENDAEDLSNNDESFQQFQY